MYLYLSRNGKIDRQDISRGSISRSGLSEELVRAALRDYCRRRKLLLSDQEMAETVIHRDDKGKPSFPRFSPFMSGNPTVHFSVSHSGDFWGCLMAEEPVGFDMEVLREKVNYIRVAQRFFTEEEYALILLEGRDTFFDIWVRKEAYVKYLGTGLAEGLSSFSTVENGKLSPQVKGTSCQIRPCEVHAGVKAAYCCTGGTPLMDIINLEMDY